MKIELLTNAVIGLQHSRLNFPIFIVSRCTLHTDKKSSEKPFFSGAWQIETLLILFKKFRVMWNLSLDGSCGNWTRFIRKKIVDDNIFVIDSSFENQIHRMTVSDSSKTIAQTHWSNDNHTCRLVKNWLGLWEHSSESTAGGSRGLAPWLGLWEHSSK